MLRPYLVLPILVSSSLAGLAPVHTAVAQPSRPSFQRADSLRGKTRDKVFRDRVKANWLQDGKRFWYQIKVGPDTHRFILVDAASGVRTDAFDHEKLAVGLSEATGHSASGDSLPLRTLAFSEDGATMEFAAGSTKWKCDLATYALEKIESSEASSETTVNILPAPRPAIRNGEETNIVLVNRTEEKVKLFWVSSVENPQFYQELEPGQEHSQHTFSGHVWLATDQNDQPLAVYEAIDTEGVAIIDGTWRPGQRQGRARGGSGGSRRGGPGRRPGARATSPDGRWTARIEDHNVVLRDQETEEEIPLSTNGTEADPYQARFYWADDSKKLVVVQQRKGENRQVQFIESSPRDQVQPKTHSFTYEKPGDRIAHPRPRLFDLEKKTQLEISDELFSNPWSITQIRWASDSSRFTFLYNQRGHQILRLVAVDAATGAATAIIDETSKTFICYSSKTFLRQFDESNEIIWMSERDGWNHLYLIDSQSGEVTNQITKGDWVVRGVEHIDAENRQIWFTAGGIHSGQDPYQVHYCRVNFDGSQLVALTEGNGTHSIEFSPDRAFFVDTYSRVDLPPVSELRQAGDGALVCKLEEGDWSALLDAGWQPPERFVAKGRDGATDIYGVIFRPTTFDPDKKYPVIEKIYAGPHSSHVPKKFAAYHGAQAMAELGFILVQIDGMGTSNRSKKFHDVCWQNLADAGFPDRVLWMKAAATTRPWMDITRVGIFGGSAGGQNAMGALITHGDFYHAAAADCGCHDNRMDKIWWNEQWMGWPVGPHYAQSSNVEQAHRLQGHLMLLVGEMDRNVDPASTMQVVNALVKADKDFDLIVIPGGGHGSGGGRYGTRRQRDFFIRHLQGVEP